MVELHIPPPPPDHYVMREEAEAQLQTQLLDKDRPITVLHGAKGIGKTSLAARVVQNLQNDQHFPHGIVWINGPAPRLEDSLWKVLCTIKSFWEIRQRPIGSRFYEEFWRELGQLRVLFVLDNVTNEQDINTFLFGSTKLKQEHIDRIVSYRLRLTLEKRLSDGELHNLCFDLNIDYDNLPSAGKANKIEDLITYCYRDDRIAELIMHYRKIRENDLLSEFLPGYCRILAISKTPLDNLPLAYHEHTLSGLTDAEALALFQQHMNSQQFNQHQDRLREIAKDLHCHPEFINITARSFRAGTASPETYGQHTTPQNSISTNSERNSPGHHTTPSTIANHYQMTIHVSKEQLHGIWQDFQGGDEHAVGT